MAKEEKVESTSASSKLSRRKNAKPQVESEKTVESQKQVSATNVTVRNKVSKEKKPTIQSETFVVKTESPESQPKASPKKRKLDPINVEVPDIEECAVAWTPTNWEKILTNIREMRKHRDAPVDTMGCHKCSEVNADAKVTLI